MSSCHVHFNTEADRDRCISRLHGLEWKGHTLKAVVRPLDKSCVCLGERLYIGNVPSSFTLDKIVAEIEKIVGNDIGVLRIFTPKAIYG